MSIPNPSNVDHISPFQSNILNKPSVVKDKQDSNLNSDLFIENINFFSADLKAHEGKLDENFIVKVSTLSLGSTSNVNNNQENDDDLFAPQLKFDSDSALLQSEFKAENKEYEAKAHKSIEITHAEELAKKNFIFDALAKQEIEMYAADVRNAGYEVEKPEVFISILEKELEIEVKNNKSLQHPDLIKDLLQKLKNENTVYKKGPNGEKISLDDSDIEKLIQILNPRIQLFLEWQKEVFLQYSASLANFAEQKDIKIESNLRQIITSSNLRDDKLPDIKDRIVTSKDMKNLLEVYIRKFMIFQEAFLKILKHINKSAEEEKKLKALWIKYLILIKDIDTREISRAKLTGENNKHEILNSSIKEVAKKIRTIIKTVFDANYHVPTVA